MTPTDEELVVAFQSGDIPAFDQLVRRWDRRIQGVIFRLVGNHDEARDVSQEAFLKAYRALGTFKQEAQRVVTSVLSGLGKRLKKIFGK